MKHALAAAACFGGLTALLLAPAGHAGAGTIGVHAGMTMSKFSRYPGDVAPAADGLIGAFVVQPLLAGLGLQAELNYSRKRAVLKSSWWDTRDNDLGIEDFDQPEPMPALARRIAYVEVPVLLKLAPLRGRLYALGGAAPALRVQDDTYRNHRSPMPTAFYKGRLGVGAVVGGGLSLAVASRVASVELRYEHGFVNANELVGKTRTLTVLVGCAL